MSKKPEYGKLTREHIKEALEYVFRDQPKKDPNERVIKIMRGCDTHGFLGFAKHCGEEKCHPCDVHNKEVNEIFKKEITEQWATEILKEWQPEVWYGEKHGTEEYLAIEPLLAHPLTPDECYGSIITEESLTIDEIIERYGTHLTKEQLKTIKKK
jgi:uncharacterized protein (DUF433 family)